MKLLEVAQERPEARNGLCLRFGEEEDEAQQGDLDRRGDLGGGHPPLEERVCEEDGEEKQQDDGKKDDVGNREIADVHQRGVAAKIREIMTFSFPRNLGIPARGYDSGGGKRSIARIPAPPRVIFSVAVQTPCHPSGGCSDKTRHFRT